MHIFHIYRYNPDAGYRPRMQTDVCPKGLNPALAINAIRDMLVRRTV